MASRATSSAGDLPPRRVALVAGTPRTLLGARNRLLRELIARGVEVMCIAPEFSSEQKSQLLVLGAEHATFNLEPKGPALLADWTMKRELAEVFRNWSPDTVIAMSERVMALAVLAARRARVKKRVALFNGFVARGGVGMEADKDPLRASPRLLSRALKASTVAVFHNRDDLREVERDVGLPPGLDTPVIPGAGVDLDAFAASPLPPLVDGPVFLMVSALDEARGVLEYCEAARRVKSRAPRAEFLHAGPAGEGVSAIGAERLRSYSDAVTFLGPLTDVRPSLARCHAFVYPSHREGMPRAVQEALAVGRPVITTAVAGCRETADDCVNGMLVPPQSVDALADAMTRLLVRPDLMASMARASRAKAERHFDERQVLAKWMRLLGLPAKVVEGQHGIAA